MTDPSSPLRIGAVNYLNSKPLIHGFDECAERLTASNARLGCDLPSRLADSLAAARYDVALIPVFEYFLDPTYRLVSDACVASDGPVSSVKLYFRTPPEKVRRLALDEGSRTSAALSRVLLARRCGVRPAVESLPIGAGLSDSDADAVLLIGDRAMKQLEPQLSEQFVAEWDLGEEWRRDTGLPFVFAAWVARAEVDPERVAPLLTACRDTGVASFAEIAAEQAPGLGLREEHAERYLRENLRFHFGERERAGLDAFRRACEETGLLLHPTTT